MTQTQTTRPGAVTAVAAIGTLVASAGVAHAMYDALAPDRPGPHVLPLGEALTAAVFLDLVVATCAQRARTRAGDAKAARLDVTVVLVAAVLSGLVSGLHAGWTVAGLFRLAVPIMAALVWLGDVVTVLRAQRETDHERALRAVLAAVRRRTEAGHAQRYRDRRIRRADVALVRAMSVYAGADGDRRQLARRVNEVHHRADLLGPLGPSPWHIPLSDPAQTWPVPRPLPGPWPPLALPGPDSSGQADPDPLLASVKTLVSDDPAMGRTRLMEALREQGHPIGTERAKALLRSARSADPASRVNGGGRHHR